ncbi:hypothetical protein SALB1_0873 [Salinisphaera sp. LB1]|nr:hypothetical protein SALB1_0873 [Salinisphaera sp. LB1]
MPETRHPTRASARSGRAGRLQPLRGPWALDDTASVQR